MKTLTAAAAGAAALSIFCLTLGTNLVFPGPDPAATAPAAPSATASVEVPNPVKIDHVTVKRVADGPRDQFTAEPGDDRAEHLPAGWSVVSVTATVRNTGSSPTSIPTDVALRLTYGPNTMDAKQIAPPSSYREPHSVPAVGTADLVSLFSLPTADVTGSVLYVPFPTYDGGGDIDAPLQSVTLTKASAR